MTSRRAFLLGTASLVAAPAIVRISSLMPVKVFDVTEVGYLGLAQYKAEGCAAEFDGGVTLQMIRDQLLPGLLSMDANYRHLESHWGKVMRAES
jgi:hypothetical protein